MGFGKKKVSYLAELRELQKARGILSLSDNFTAEELQSKFTSLVKSVHPDHGGDTVRSYEMGKIIKAKNICKEHLKGKP